MIKMLLSLLPSVLLAAVWLSSVSVSASATTWPNPDTDFLESLLYQQSGYHQLIFGSLVQNCDAETVGRSFSAGSLRLAFHDMATADLDAGTGGLDASIIFDEEKNRPQNNGVFVDDAVREFRRSMSARSSMADLFALGTVVAVGSCSGGEVQIPFRGGRRDASAADMSGVVVPEPHFGVGVFREIFDRLGFDNTEMISLVACGHTLGGVHGVDFPQIVDVFEDPSNTESEISFDETPHAFDNSVAAQFVANVTQNPLAFDHNETTRSDARIFNSDGGKVIRKMAKSNKFYLDTCELILEKMINTVPGNVHLSNAITPYDVKPDNLDIAIGEDGDMTINGEIRIKDIIPNSPTRLDQVLVHILPRSGNSSVGVSPVSATNVGSTQGIYANAPSFQWYKFSKTVPAIEGVSLFTIEAIDGAGNSTWYTNGGKGFPLKPEILPQTSLSCALFEPSRVLNVTVAVLDEVNFSSVVLSVPMDKEQAGTALVPKFETQEIVMKKTRTLEGTGYSLYTGSVSWFDKEFLTRLTYDVIGRGGKGREVEKAFNLFARLNSC